MAGGQLTTGGTRPKYRIELIDKVFGVLGAFTPERRELTLREITDLTGQSQSSTYRILVNLTRLGAVARDGDTHRYRIGPRLHELGSLAFGQLRRVALPALDTLRHELGYTANLGVRDGDEVILVEVLESAAPFSLSSTVGAREPLAATACGKCLLAFEQPDEQAALIERLELHAWTASSITNADALIDELERVRRCGYALDDGEFAPHARCVAVPLFDRLGFVCAAVSLCGPDGLLAPERREPLVARLLEVGEAISRELGAGAGYPPAVQITGTG